MCFHGTAGNGRMQRQAAKGLLSPPVLPGYPSAEGRSIPGISVRQPATLWAIY